MFRTQKIIGLFVVALPFSACASLPPISETSGLLVVEHKTITEKIAPTKDSQKSVANGKNKSPLKQVITPKTP